MILRKPYALLIKNFKLIHAAMTLFMAYILYKTLNVLSAFNEYFSSQTGLIGGNLVEKTYSPFMFVAPILIIILTMVLFSVMLVKQKPSSLYIVTIVVYIFATVMFGISKSTLLNMEINILDVRAIKIVRDFTTMSFMAQLYPLVKSLVRAVGFDIREFDFGKDLAELEIEEADSEEFEVNVSVDTNKMKRGVNYQKRNLKYIYRENKFLINIAIAIIVLIIGLIIGVGMLTRGTTKAINSTFQISNFSMKVTNAYVTRKDYRGNELPNLNEKMSLIVIPFNVKNNSSKDKGFLTANIELDIGEHKFRNSITYRDSVYDLGYVYNGEDIKGGELAYKSFIFEVPTSYLNEDIKLRFITSINIKGTDLVPTYITIPIRLNDLDKAKQAINIEKNQDIDLKDTVLGKSNLNISNIEVGYRFKIDYNYPVINDEIISSYEYLYAPLNDNIRRSLLKVSATYDAAESSNVSNLADLINNYGVLKYTINDKNKSLNTTARVMPTRTKNVKTVYIAVPSEVENATNAILELKIRNNIYEYKIK